EEGGGGPVGPDASGARPALAGARPAPRVSRAGAGAVVMSVRCRGALCRSSLRRLHPSARAKTRPSARPPDGASAAPRRGLQCAPGAPRRSAGGPPEGGPPVACADAEAARSPGGFFCDGAARSGPDHSLEAPMTSTTSSAPRTLAEASDLTRTPALAGNTGGRFGAYGGAVLPPPLVRP